jgi:hypothetical protein
VTEVTTRRLGTPAQPFMHGQNVAGPQAMEQRSGPTEAALTAETRALAERQAPRRWLPGVVLLLIVVLLPTFLIVKRWQQNRIAKIVHPPIVAPQPPKPPQPPSAGDTSANPVNPRFLYPGARTTMVISKAGEGNTVQLQTDDSLNKVADWYIEKFEPTERVLQKGSVILKVEDVSVIITSNGTGTNIMLAQRDNN